MEWPICWIICQVRLLLRWTASTFEFSERLHYGSAISHQKTWWWFHWHYFVRQRSYWTTCFVRKGQGPESGLIPYSHAWLILLCKVWEFYHHDSSTQFHPKCCGFRAVTADGAVDPIQLGESRLTGSTGIMAIQQFTSLCSFLCLSFFSSWVVTAVNLLVINGFTFLSLYEHFYSSWHSTFIAVPLH